MARIFFVIVRIYRNQLKRKYLKNKKKFLDFLLHFWNLHSILFFFKKRYILIVYVLQKLRTGKDVVRQMSKKPRFRIPFDSLHVKVSQNTCENCMTVLLSYFFITLGETDLKNLSLSDMWNLTGAY